MYYEVKLKVMKPNKDGLEKEVKEHFITDCSLFAEAEAKGLEQYASDNMESDVFSISRSNIIEIINEKTEDKPFFKATIVDMQFISDWFIPMDFGNDMPDEDPDGEDNFNFD